jgi:dTDP-glucose 4,6-dehydratase
MASRELFDGPSIIEGVPAFPEGLPLAVPSVPTAESVFEDIEIILGSGVLTNGPYVQELEERAADYLGVRHCVAVSSCTAGLMLVLRAADLFGDVVVPSFTFAATAHAVAWNGLRPVFSDIDPATLTLSAGSVLRAGGVRTAAILATHTYGTPCDVEGLTEAARREGVRLFFDAAHAFGSRRGGEAVGGFGDAEVFSLSPTKVLTACEGGIISTNDDLLAERCRTGRNYGNPGDYDCRFVGLNARMSEIHAVIALGSLDGLDDQIRRRNELAGHYRRLLEDIPGISFPFVREGDLSTYKDLTIMVDPEEFGAGAADLGRALASEGIETRHYYAPPVHEMRAYRYVVGANVSSQLRVTERVSSRVISLPLWYAMTEHQVSRMAEVLWQIHRSRRKVIRLGDESTGVTVGAARPPERREPIEPLVQRFLVTGGLGFIGSQFLRRVVGRASALTNVDVGTYAGDERRVEDLAARFQLRALDVADEAFTDLVASERPSVIVHFAAESHVTRSESAGELFYRTNVEGTRRVMETAERVGVDLVIHVSTDEVYGPCSGEPFKETDKEAGEGLATSAYAKSKAIADEIACSFAERVPVIIARPTNCFGPWQHPEKAVPRWTTRALLGERLPVWGDGGQVRDWMYVGDCCEAIALLIENGKPGTVYNIAPENSPHTNLEIAHAIASGLRLSRDAVYLTEYDRPDHDRRYAVDASRIRALGWNPTRSVEERIEETVDWYRANRWWWEPLVSDAEALYSDARERKMAL